MKKHILIIFTSLLLFSCSKSNEEIMIDTVKSYLSQSYSDSDYIHELKSIDIKLDTIPEYFNVALIGDQTKPNAANNAVIALDFLRRLNSPSVKLMVQTTGKPYSMFCMDENKYYYEEDAYMDLANFESELKSAKQNIVPAVEYIAYVVEKFRRPNETKSRESKRVIVLDKNNPTKIIKSYVFYGITMDEIAAVKYVQAQGNMKTDTFGRFDTSDWYNVEKFILSDRLNGDIIQLLGFDK